MLQDPERRRCSKRPPPRAVLFNLVGAPLLGMMLIILGVSLIAWDFTIIASSEKLRVFVLLEGVALFLAGMVFSVDG